ncbi:MAG: 16S rRNA (guanine527-N7)-methyltransferase [Paraglaciecola sp.]|jgi:16S rRNA (guanine527-N7)-methyltransferase
MDILKKYFPDLTEMQLEQLARLPQLYKEWNAKINVISRKDVDNIEGRHILHSLSLIPIVRFRSGADILDLGTGGGFPGIPLAIFYPDVNFHLVDGTAKKIRVVQEIIDALGLKNVKAEQMRAEEIKNKRYDFVACRAVASIDKLHNWTLRLFKKEHQHALPNGLLTLKGGDLTKELKLLPKGNYVEKYRIQDFFKEDYFEEKYVVYLQG